MSRFELSTQCQVPIISMITLLEVCLYHDDMIQKSFSKKRKVYVSDQVSFFCTEERLQVSPSLYTHLNPSKEKDFEINLRNL